MRELERIAELIRSSERICIAAHLNPDGDCIGSSLALSRILRLMGKTVHVYDRDPAPSYMDYMDGFHAIRRVSEGAEKYDLFIAVDCSGLDRIVNFRDEAQKAALDALLARCGHIVQIDHHGTNPRGLEVNAVDEDASAAGLLIWRLMKILGVPMDREIAECLYTAVATDTGNFSQDNVRPECFDMMSEIARTPVQLSRLCRILFAQRSHAQVGLITSALQTLCYREHDTVTGRMLTEDDMAKHGAMAEDADTVVNFGRDIRGVHMTVLARETEEGVKMSFRSIAPWRIDEVAKQFGGGGHAQAAGCTIPGARAGEALEAALDALCEAHRQQEGA